MLVDNQIYNVKWTKKNVEWYKNKGYIFTNYGDYFDVKAEDLISGSNQIVKVQCDFCGTIVDARWRDYLKCSKDGLYACKKHRQLKTSNKYRKERIHKQYVEVLQYCEQNNYILLTDEQDLYNCFSTIKYVCPKHGEHTTNLLALTQKHGCSQCQHENTSVSQRLSYEQIMSVINKYNGVLLNVDEYQSWNTKNLKMICPECGNMFITSLNSFAKHGGQRCQDCSNIESKGEYKIRTFFENNNIYYIPQYRFENCRYKATLPFDFYLPQINVAIEYDGEHHFMPIKRGSMNEDDAKNNLLLIQHRDQIKNNYCIDNNIKLIRIPYYEYDNIDIILYKNLIDNSHNDIV